jgi:hypothetical protein
MFFAHEDELAVHTVASAAYRFISDLKAERGRDEVGDYYLTAILYCVRDYRRGTLPATVKLTVLRQTRPNRALNRSTLGLGGLQ